MHNSTLPHVPPPSHTLQADMQKQIQREKALAEAEGRIRENRDNEDINRRAAILKYQEETKKAIESINTIFSHLGGPRFHTYVRAPLGPVAGNGYKKERNHKHCSPIIHQMSGASLTARLLLNPLLSPPPIHSQAMLPWSSSLTTHSLMVHLMLSPPPIHSQATLP